MIYYVPSYSKIYSCSEQTKFLLQIWVVKRITAENQLLLFTVEVEEYADDDLNSLTYGDLEPGWFCKSAFIPRMITCHADVNGLPQVY